MNLWICFECREKQTRQIHWLFFFWESAFGFNLTFSHCKKHPICTFSFHNITNTKKIHVQHFWSRFRCLFSKDSFLLHHFESLSCIDDAQKIDIFHDYLIKSHRFWRYLSWTFQFALICSAFSAFFFIVFGLMYIFSKKLSAALIRWSRWASEAAYFKFSEKKS